MTDKQDKTGEDEIEIKLEWGKIEDLASVYANQLYISRSKNEFYLIFGEINLPTMLDISPENVPNKIEIKPVMKVVITHNAMLEFANAINTNIARFLSQQEQSEDE